jgi:hypothetical protein
MHAFYRSASLMQLTLHPSASVSILHADACRRMHAFHMSASLMQRLLHLSASVSILQMHADACMRSTGSQTTF